MVEDAHHFFIAIYAASVSGGMEIDMKKTGTGQSFNNLDDLWAGLEA